jgi:8-oxo-dGTP diphosphatase
MLLDKNGMTEEEFLKAYDPSKYERPSVTVDIILFDGTKVLLIKRGGHPFIGMRALPGGFVEPHESAEQAALRELFEETGTTDVALKQLGSFSDPDRDPRTRIITIAFTAQFLNGSKNVKAGDDAEAADWFDVTVIPEKTYSDNSGRIPYSVLDYKIKLSSPSEQLTCGIKQKTPLLPFPADVVYEINGTSQLAGDHAKILAAAIDARKDLFGDLS